MQLGHCYATQDITVRQHTHIQNNMGTTLPGVIVAHRRVGYMAQPLDRAQPVLPNAISHRATRFLMTVAVVNIRAIVIIQTKKPAIAGFFLFIWNNLDFNTTVQRATIDS